MTRYNNHYSGETLEGIDRIDGYREGVERVLWFLNDWDGEGQLVRDIRDAIEEGII